MKTKKAQAAMEYLMTYGWAILIVIIVAAALFALGVFNPTAWTGQQATGFGGLGTPSDWELKSDGTFNIKLENSLAGKTVTVYNITAELGSTSVTWTTYDYDDALGHLVLGTGASVDLSTLVGTNNPYSIDLGSPTTGSSFSIKITINMITESGAYPTAVVGTLTGTVKEA
ncbi:MAG: hypothetical protein ABIF08_01820 [Nanoarchaeota archaeon]